MTIKQTVFTKCDTGGEVDSHAWHPANLRLTCRSFFDFATSIQSGHEPRNSKIYRRTGSCGASFARCVALAVREGQRWPCISRSNGSMLAGRSKRGGKPLTRSLSTS